MMILSKRIVLLFGLILLSLQIFATDPETPKKEGGSKTPSLEFKNETASQESELTAESLESSFKVLQARNKKEILLVYAKLRYYFYDKKDLSLLQRSGIFPFLHEHIKSLDQDIKSAAAYTLGLYVKKNPEGQQQALESGTLNDVFNNLAGVLANDDLKLDMLSTFSLTMDKNPLIMQKFFTKRKIKVFTGFLKKEDHLTKAIAARIIISFFQRAEELGKIKGIKDSYEYFTQAQSLELLIANLSSQREETQYIWLAFIFDYVGSGVIVELSTKAKEALVHYIAFRETENFTNKRLARRILQLLDSIDDLMVKDSN